MRLCIVGPTYPYRGGIAHYTTLLVRHLRLAGHDTKLYSFTRQYPSWLFPGKSDKDPSAAALKIECEYILDPVNPITWWRLCRQIRSDNPELLVLQWWVPYWTPCLTAISRWLKRNTSIPIVYICHNVVPHDGGGVLDRRFALSVLRQGDAFIVHSDQDRFRLQALLPEAHIFKSHHPSYAELADVGHGQSAHDVRHEYGIAADVPVLLFFGFVRPYKGLEYLIQALPLVLRERKVHLLVVGEFWSDPAFYEQFAREVGAEHAITFVNRYVPNEDLQPFFDASDAVVLPYISATQSGVAQLAFGFGKPVITTRVGGLYEVVQDGVNGLVVPPQDEQALAEAILRFYREGMAAPMERTIRERMAGDAFSWRGLVSVIEEIAGQRL